MSHSSEQLELGRTSTYESQYNPHRLLAIPRQGQRDELGISPQQLPFYGFDLWNHYEVSWLNSKGKPEVAVAEISYPCDSPCIIESKTMKLYFNSFNNTQFKDTAEVIATVTADLSERVGAAVTVKITLLHQFKDQMIRRGFEGTCLDTLDVACDVYQVTPDFLKILPERVENACLYSDLLKSNCLVTNQPDWGSVQIGYTGKKIDPAGLLKYIVSFRNHNEFHEHCIERIFVDIIKYCQPQKLFVYGRYTRRGGLDINPYRSTEKDLPADINVRLYRQ